MSEGAVGGCRPLEYYHEYLRLLATDGHRGMLRDLSTPLRRFLPVGHRADVSDPAFAPDGRTLATANADRAVRL
jgi:hypothetical protein